MLGSHREMTMPTAPWPRCSSETGIEHGGRTALPRSTSEKIIWGFPDSEDATSEEWIRLPHDLGDPDEVEVSDKGIPAGPVASLQLGEDGGDRLARDILLQAAAAIGHADRVAPIIKAVVEDNWLETAEDLRSISEHDRKEFKIPGSRWPRKQVASAVRDCVVLHQAHTG